MTERLHTHKPRFGVRSRKDKAAADMRHALLVNAAFLNALAGRLSVGKDAKVTFKGDHEHLGTVTLGEALDLADAALAKADPTEQEG